MDKKYQIYVSDKPGLYKFKQGYARIQGLTSANRYKLDEKGQFIEGEDEYDIGRNLALKLRDNNLI